MIKLREGAIETSAPVGSGVANAEFFHSHTLLASLQKSVDALPNEYTNLVHRLFLSPRAPGRHLVAFVAVDDHAEASLVCAQTARLLTYRTGHSASVLDLSGEISVPGVSGISGEHHLRDNAGELRINDLRAAADDLGGGLWVISGAKRRREVGLLVGSSELHGFVRAIRQQFHFGLVVCPPLASMIESVALCAECDAVVLVIGAASKRSASFECAKLLRGLDVPLTGAVLTGRLK